MRKIEALTASLVLLLMLSTTARIAQAQRPDRGGGSGLGDRARDGGPDRGSRDTDRSDSSRDDDGPAAQADDARAGPARGTGRVNGVGDRKGDDGPDTEADADSDDRVPSGRGPTRFGGAGAGAGAGAGVGAGDREDDAPAAKTQDTARTGRGGLSDRSNGVGSRSDANGGDDARAGSGRDTGRFNGIGSRDVDSRDVGSRDADRSRDGGSRTQQSAGRAQGTASTVKSGAPLGHGTVSRGTVSGHSTVGKGLSSGHVKVGEGIPCDDKPTVKVTIQGIKVLECQNCGENAVLSVSRKDLDIEYRGDPSAVPLRFNKAISCTATEDEMAGVWLKAELKLKSDTKFAEGTVDFISRTFDCCNPISVQYTPLAEDACDVLSDVNGQRNHKCYQGPGCHKAYGCSRPSSNKVCVKAHTVTRKKLETILIGAPDSTGLQVGCKQTEGLFVDGNTGAVLGCLRLQWSVCVNSDCGGSDVCGCGDSSVFSNPRCGRCLQSRAERLGICADFFTFAQAPADTCEWRECCCDADGTTGGTPCSSGNVGSCDDKSCRRHS